MALSNFRFPTDIRYGNEAIALLPALLKQAGVKRPLFVTDRGLAQQEVCRQVLGLLHQNNIEAPVFAEAAGNPVAAQVRLGVEAYKQEKADGIIMFGGGCAIDVAKAIALMVYHPGQLFDYEDDKPGALPIDKPIPPTIAIPTTAGTGSEVGGSTVISDDRTHQKYIMWSPRLIPRHVIADPTLTTSLPAAVTAATGIDALTHNVEAFLAKNYHPICDGIALEGLSLIAGNLHKAVSEPTNLEARGAMLLASMMGAIAFQKGLGVTHSCAHALSTCYDLHHGLANGLMIVACMEFNAEAVPERFVRLGRTLGFHGKDDAIITSFMDWLRSLRRQLPLPNSLKSLEVEITPRLIETAMSDACHTNNPRPVSQADFTALFKKALAE